MPRSAGGLNQVVRVIRILRRLQGRRRGLRFEELQDDYGVSRSQLRRDLLALQEAGVRLETDQEPGRYGRRRVYLLDSDFVRVPFTRTERYTLLAIRRIFDLFRGTGFHEDVQSIYDKVLESAPDAERRDVGRLRDQIVYLPAGGTKDYRGHEETINALQTGVMDGRPVETTYKPRRGRRSSSVLEPYAFVLYRNGLYVVGSRRRDDRSLQEPRVFAVERFERVTLTRKQYFEPPEDLDIEELFDGSFGLISGPRKHHVVVEFSKDVRAEVMTRSWHRTQVRTELPGGRVRIEFDVTSLREVESWVLEWGPKARALEPPELVERVRTALSAAIGQYRDSPDPTI